MKKAKIDESQQGRDVKKRVNITIGEKTHKDATRYAEEHGTNFSRLVRDAVVDHMSSSDGSSSTAEIQSVIKRLDRVEEGIGRNRVSIENLCEITERIATELGPDVEHVAKRIEQEIYDSDRPLSIPDLVERLSMKPPEIEAGVQYLEQRYAVERIDSADSNTSVPRWKPL